ncbi:hypothetical protein [Polaromonas sp.]|jgi:hypothetical protein|uniref:hypothetical protein n=1 Tax=Polaromonas sp. TaxID=1869339 RepID=UPI001A322071|nr:hypothetical protein [Burkholderiales bacterium]MBH2020260.1 hypothetical protein [Burkholderiales bacterium]
MSSSEKLAIAAHLHVLLRRKTGRVTDTEWMASNPAYAAEVIRIAHEKAAEGGHDDLGLLADRLEAAMAVPEAPAYKPLAQRVSDAAKANSTRPLGAKAPARPEPAGNSVFGDSQLGVDGTPRPNVPRYVKGLR